MLTTKYVDMGSTLFHTVGSNNGRSNPKRGKHCEHGPIPVVVSEGHHHIERNKPSHLYEVYRPS